MATNKYNLNSPFIAVFKPEETQKKTTIKSLLITVAIFTFVLALVNGMRSFAFDESFFTNLFYAFISAPIFFFALYLPIHIFISALEKHKKGFIESYLMFSSYILPILLFGHLIAFIPFTKLLEILVTILVIIIGTVIVRNIKTYFKTTLSKSVTALLLTIMLYTTISLPIYLVSLIQSASV